MNFFSGFVGVEAVKGEYRRLAMIHHPDRGGGDTATMQELNRQYHAALSGVDGTESRGSDDRTHTYRYNRATEQAVMDKVDEIVGLGMPGVEIWLIGVWIWIVGDTKPHAGKLGKNGAGCRWHRKRNAWYWHDGAVRRPRFNSRASLSGIAETYGVRSFSADEDVMAPLGNG